MSDEKSALAIAVDRADRLQVLASRDDKYRLDKADLDAIKFLVGLGNTVRLLQDFIR